MNSSSDYWRKLLKIEEPVPSDFFARLQQQNRLLGNVLYRLFNFLAGLLFRVEVKGLENVPNKGPFILASNHLSALDYPFLIYGLSKETKEQLYVIGKKYLFDRPILKFFIKLGAKVFPVDTEGDFLPALQTATKILQAKKSIYIAPEGARSFDGKMGEFRVGVGVLAVEAGVPIVPVIIKGTFEVLDRKSFIPHLHQVKVIFGKPLDPAPYIVKKQGEMAYYVYKEITDELKNKMLELQAKLDKK